MRHFLSPRHSRMLIFMQLKTQLYIDGKWIDGTSTMPVTDPSDESVIANVQVASDKECAQAVDAAAKAFKTWSKSAPRVRAEILRKAFEIMVAESDRLAEIISKENGKVLSDAKGEILYAAEFFRWFAEEAVRINGEFRMAPAGFRITVQPAASAGPIFRVAIAAGKFQGVIKSETPIGCLVTTIFLSPLGEVRYSPLIRTASSENQRKNSAAYKISPLASVNTLPFSLETISANRSASATIISNAFRKISPRMRGAVFAQLLNARSAASTASAHSLSDETCTLAITDSSLGSITAKVDEPLTHLPSI